MEEALSPSPEPEKPAWLRQLEQESWQAELIISGIAIFGALNLPGLIERQLERTAFHAAEGELLLWFLFFTYLILAANALIIGFISHFVLRTLWIGLIGLASVYPEGIRTEHARYSKAFMERVRDKFPGPREFNERLDRLCSLLFAIIASATLIFGSISLSLIALYLVGMGIATAVPILESTTFPLIVLFIFVFISMLVEIMNASFLKNRKWVRKAQFPLYWLSFRCFANVFYLPAGYIQWTLNSNTKRNQFTTTFLFLSAVISIIGIYNLINIHNLPYIMPDGFHYERSRPFYQSVRNYESTRQGHFAFEAAIPDEQISGRFLPVFVPILGREEAVLDSLCGSWKKDEALSRNENRRRHDAFRIDCYQKYLTFYVNDSLYQDIDLTLRNRTQTDPAEIGVRAFLLTDGFRVGKNLLQVRKACYDEAGNAKVYTIPFWYSPE